MNNQNCISKRSDLYVHKTIHRLVYFNYNFHNNNIKIAEAVGAAPATCVLLS